MAANPKVSDGKWKYDVFLSFRGDDTRKSFTDHLYYALRDVGIHVFRDNNELRRGEIISRELERAIQTSQIAIIVFSKNYATSKWCLEELVRIMECRRTLNQVVLPIFYDVHPSHVRNQKGRSFEDAFVQHQKRFVSDNRKVLRWRMALTQAANLAGFELKNSEDGHEGKFIKKIVETVLRYLKSRSIANNLYVALYQVGIDSRVNAIMSKLDVGISGGVRIVGIWGMGGVGKTTIAIAVYNLLHKHFEGACFLDSFIKDHTSKQSSELAHLQGTIFKAIFKSNETEVQNMHQRLQQKKVLLVLDDIDDTTQLKVLARNRDWFGAGSRIIITTRDEHLLKYLKVDAICTIDEMSEIEALELFSWHAFDNCCPSDQDYYQISKSVVKYCGGLPLALEVLGSFLRDRMILEWEDALNKIKTIPHDEIQEKLKISYDGLKDQTYKDIFLNISCFFIGMDKNEVTQILDGCGLFPISGISVLLQRCLLKVDSENKLVMHDLLRDMGREIVRCESLEEPERRSRLFVNDDVLNVLEKQKGTGITKGLSLKLSISSNKVLETEAFDAMQNLRLLQLNYALILGDFKHLPQELRWVCWHGFPIEALPENFNLEKVKVIDLMYSRLTKFFRKEPKFSMEKLTILNLSHSHYLKATPNFSKLPHLEILRLKDCKSLVKVDESIGSLSKLVFIDLQDCVSLNELPESLCEVKSVEKLILSGCIKLRSLPKNLGRMESLTTLDAKCTCIQELPSTIVGLKKLKHLSISRSSKQLSVAETLWSWIFPRSISNSIVHLPTSLRGLESLTELYLSNCNLSDDAIPNDIGRSLVSLVVLDLGGNEFHAVPSSIKHLSKLERLWLDDCSNLEHISNLPPNLRALSAIGCKALESISDLSNTKSMMLDMLLSDCPNLTQISSISPIYINGCHSMLKHTLFQDNYILQRLFEIKEGIKVESIFEEIDCSSFLGDASQQVDDHFNFQGCFKASYPSEFTQKLYCSPLRNGEDGASAITHTIGKACFVLTEQSSQRRLQIHKYYWKFGRCRFNILVSCTMEDETKTIKILTSKLLMFQSRQTLHYHTAPTATERKFILKLVRWLHG